MNSRKWWYLVAMTAVGVSIAVMIWAAGERIAIVTVLACLSAAYWGLVAFGAAGDISEQGRAQKLVQQRLGLPEDFSG